MLIGFPHRLHGEHRDRQRGVHDLQSSLQNPLVDVHVHGDRQVRPVLLYGRHLRKRRGLGGRQDAAAAAAAGGHHPTRGATKRPRCSGLNKCEDDVP